LLLSWRCNQYLTADYVWDSEEDARSFLTAEHAMLQARHLMFL